MSYLRQTQHSVLLTLMNRTDYYAARRLVRQLYALSCCDDSAQRRAELYLELREYNIDIYNCWFYRFAPALPYEPIADRIPSRDADDIPF
jgi:hypothetical protein